MKELDNYKVVSIENEGIAIVDDEGHFWLVLPEGVCEARGQSDKLAAEHLSRLGA